MRLKTLARKEAASAKKRAVRRGRRRARWWPYQLWVEYRTQGRNAYEWGWLDGDIRDAAGGLELGSGTAMFGDMRRDLNFGFNNKRSAESARRRVKKLGRVLSAKVHKIGKPKPKSHG